MTTPTVPQPAVFTPGPPTYRAPLGLPAGSVRAALVLMIVIPFWLVLLFPHPESPVVVPLFLYFNLGLVLLFFTSHSTPGLGVIVQQRPWWIAGGIFRWLIFLGTVAVVGYRLYVDRALLIIQLTPLPDQLPQWPGLLLAVMAGFGFGWLFRHGPWRDTAWFQDVQAWVSLLATFGLLIAVFAHLFVFPTLTADKPNIEFLESILTTFVACYFGFRS